MNVICAFVFIAKVTLHGGGVYWEVVKQHNCHAETFRFNGIKASKLKFFFTIKKLRKLRMRTLTSLIP